MTNDRTQYAKEMGLRIRKAREAAGLSRAAVTARFGWADSSSLAQVELGRSLLPTHMIVPMADLLGITTDALLRG